VIDTRHYTAKPLLSGWHPIYVPISLQVIWMFVLALPVASIAWTVTHEEVFREPREFCVRQSREHRSVYRRKFFYLFTCEYCFSHYVVAVFLLITRFKLLFSDWRGYLVALFALVWLSNFYMGLYSRLRLDIKHERVAIEAVEEAVKDKKAA
jgi:hypothetical protein